MSTLTVLTATYNRAKLLPQLYRSLLIQSFRDFEWLIVDDGSSDDTESLVQGWIDEARIGIVYKKRENGGKHRAINAGIPLIHGDFCVIMDSDDYFIPDGLAIIDRYASEIANNAGIAGLMMSQGVLNPDGSSRPNGSFIDKRDFIDMPNYRRNEKKYWGDRLIVVKTSILRRYPFPEFEGEKFFSQSALWNAISADGFMWRLCKAMVCVIEYQADGLSSVFYKNRDKCYNGYVYAMRMLFRQCPHYKCFWVIYNYAVVSYKHGVSAKGAADAVRLNRFGFAVLRFFAMIRCAFIHRESANL